MGQYTDNDSDYVVLIYSVVEYIVMMVVEVQHCVTAMNSPLPKKPHPSMRVWVRSLGSSKYTCV